MRKLIFFLGVTVLAWPTAAAAQQRSDVQGFGGVTVGTSAFGSAASPTFGGRVGIGLTDHIQLVGEAGRLANISSPLFDLLDFTDLGVRVTAFYGEGGVRFMALPHSTVRPYGEATAGFARLNAGISGLGGTTGALVNTTLNVLSRTQPMLGVGGGVVVSSGPVTVDLGYRYKKISNPDALTSLLNVGNAYQVNQVRVGVGFRF